MKPAQNGIIAAFKQLCDDVGTPYARSCLTALTNGGLEALELARLPFTPSAYTTAQDFQVDYLVYSYIKKLQIPQDQKRLDEKCLLDLLKVESKNKETNRALKRKLPSQAAESLIYEVRRKIAAVLGRPEKRLYEFVELCEWGPGATYSLKAADATRDKKITEDRLSITAKAVPLFLAYQQSAMAWTAARFGQNPDGDVTWLWTEFDVVRGERFATANKQWNKRRSISIQPTLNLFLQKGFGRYARKRMKRWGIDLDDQSRNQRLAQKAFLAGDATLDLRDASNSMLCEHLRLYFEPEWVDLMESLRSPEIQLPDGAWHKLELHSGMGNGYTFEVESLLFWALCTAAVESLGFPASRVSVYGDDLIVPQECAALVIEVLEANGFSINLEKSYANGAFFESCGKHYFEGYDVTPLYEKRSDNGLNTCIRSYNRLYRWCDDRGLVDRFRATLTFLEIRAYQALLVECERRRRAVRRLSGRSRSKASRSSFTMPVQARWMSGDGGLITSDDHLPAPCKNGVWSLKHWVAQPVSLPGHGWAMYSDALRCGSSATPNYGSVTPRDTVKWKLRTRHFQKWFTPPPDVFCLKSDNLVIPIAFPRCNPLEDE